MLKKQEGRKEGRKDRRIWMEAAASLAGEQKKEIDVLDFENLIICTMYQYNTTYSYIWHLGTQ